jgi:hypothetical protein
MQPTRCAQKATTKAARKGGLCVLRRMNDRSPRRVLAFCIMKNLLCVSLLLFTSTVHAQTWRSDRATLCFVRLENNGRMNIQSSWIHYSDYEIPIVGGQAICIYTSSGAGDLYVSSTIPYEPSSKNTDACRSNTIHIDLRPKDDRLFTITPVSKRGSYVCGWRVHPGPPAASDTF